MDDEKEKSLNEWLVINCQLGDRAALERLLRTWQPRLMTYALRRLGDRELAREVVQESLLGISRGLNRLRDPAAFPGWCFRLLERRCVDAIRSRIRERQKLAEYSRAELEESAADSEATTDLERKLSVRKALAQMDSSLAVTLKLYYQESFSIEEIAGVLDIPVGTVKSRLYYGRKTLAVLLEE